MKALLLLTLTLITACSSGSKMNAVELNKRVFYGFSKSPSQRKIWDCKEIESLESKEDINTLKERSYLAGGNYVQQVSSSVVTFYYCPSLAGEKEYLKPAFNTEYRI